MEERVPKPADPGPELEALLLLAVFRRRRSIVALRSLLPRYLPPLPEEQSSDERVETFLDTLEKRGYVLRVEGGSYWMSRKIRDRIYASVQDGTRGDALRKEELKADRLVEPAVLERIALLATVHDHVADYYLSSLYAASRDLHALLEHIYHRASGLRYLTKLNRCLLLFAGGGQLDRVPATVWKRLDEIDLPLDKTDPLEAPPPDPARITRLRQSRLRSLSLVLERERELLLSGVAADTLVDWVDWMQNQDTPRFRIDLCLDRDASGRANAQSAVFARQLDPRWKSPGEERIAADLQHLWDQLDDLKASVLRDRLDVEACAELRWAQIRRLLGIEAPGSPAAAVAAWLKENAAAIAQRTLAEDIPVLTRRKVVKYLCDIWAGRRSLRDDEGMEDIERIVKGIVTPHLPRIESSPDICAMELRRLRYTADQLLAVNSMEARGDSLDQHRQVEKSSREALKICARGLQVVEWSAGSDYYRQRSYFHSLRGRAATLLGDFKTAHRELDLAQSGVVPRTGADREMFAVNLLHLAECLLLRADHVLSEACERRLLEGCRDRDDLETLSTEGCLCLLGDRAPKGGDETLDRRQIDRALADLRKGPSWPQDLAAARRLSLAHWAPDRIAEIEDWGEELEVALQRADGRLTRAEESLDQAGLTLAEARRNVEWWIFLYELRAQLRVERLLLQSTEIHALTPGREPGAWDEKKARLIARMVNDLKGGLSAVRQGLDAIDAAGVPRQLNPRVRRLILLWVELMICGASLTREIESLTRPPGKNAARLDTHNRLRWQILWEQWTSHCNSAGFSKLLRPFDIFEKFDEVTIDPNGYRGGPASRAFILASVKECQRTRDVDALLERLG